MSRDCPCCLPPWSWSFFREFQYYTHMKIDQNRGVLWIADHGQWVTCLALNASNLWIGGYHPLNTSNPTDYSTRKLELGSKPVWSISEDNEGGFIPTMSVGPDSTLVTGGSFQLGGGASYYTIRKYDVDGSLIWKRPFFESLILQDAFGVCHDPDGNIYAAGVGYGGPGAPYQRGILRGFDPSGSLLFSVDNFPSGGTFDGVATDGNSITAVGQTPLADASSPTVRNYSMSGALNWSVNEGGSSGITRCVAYCPDGGIVTGSDPDHFGMTTRKYDSSGSLLWSAAHGNSFTSVSAIAVDADGNVYTGGIIVSDGDGMTTRKYDADGNLLWSFDYSLGRSAPFGARVSGIAVDADGNVYMCGTRVTY